jgi:hypothetical protein
MRFIQHTSNNGVLGAPPGWDQKELPCGALPITRTEIDGHAVMVSFWKPDADELAALQAGKAVALLVYGNVHPVVAISVGT